jgi:hypothetical protein
MKTTMILAVLLVASASFAEEPKRELFPSDYTPAAACAPTNACESFTDITFVSAANQHLLVTLDPNWTIAHRDEMLKVVEPYCTKRATCLASPGRYWWFCNDVFAQEIRGFCDKYDEKTQHHDYESCRIWMDVYSTGVDQRGSPAWAAAQECLKKTVPASTALRKMEIWSTPATLPVKYKGVIQIFAIDTASHIPVEAEITEDGQVIYSRDVPSGKATTFYQFNIPSLTARVANAQGHTDIVPATMTLTAPGYEVLNVPVPTTIGKMDAKLSPPADKLKPGTNTITVISTDSATGKPVEGQVYIGDQTIGFTNQPIEITIEKKEKRPEIWVRSPFDLYSDVVVAQAQK